MRIVTIAVAEQIPSVTVTMYETAAETAFGIPEMRDLKLRSSDDWRWEVSGATSVLLISTLRLHDPGNREQCHHSCDRD